MLTESQLQARREGLGGSDAAAVLGLSPFKSPVQLYLEKTGELEPEDIGQRDEVLLGNELEGTVARLFAKRAGVRIARVNRTLRHPEHPFLLGNLDRRIVGAPELLEVKTVRALDDDAPRPDHVVQCMHYLSVTGFRLAHLAYLVAGQRLVFHQVERDEAAIARLIEAERAFWQGVLTRTPPPAHSALDLRLLFPKDSGEVVSASEAVQEACVRLAELRAQAKAAQDAADYAEVAVLNAMGEASELRTPDGRLLATWKQAKPSRSFDRARFEAEHPALAAGYFTEKPGSRRFLLKEIPT